MAGLNHFGQNLGMDRLRVELEDGQKMASREGNKIVVGNNISSQHGRRTWDYCSLQQIGSQPLRDFVSGKLSIVP